MALATEDVEFFLSPTDSLAWPPTTACGHQVGTLLALAEALVRVAELSPAAPALDEASSFPTWRRRIIWSTAVAFMTFWKEKGFQKVFTFD